MEQYSPAQPYVVEVNNAIQAINKQYSFITFVNNGLATGVIDFGAGQLMNLVAGESISLPYLGRVYGGCIIDATGTLIKAVYVY
jgi:hypothetical protein